MRRLIDRVTAGVAALVLTGCGSSAGAWAPVAVAPSGPATASGSATPATPTSAPPQPRTITIVGSGDVLLHPPLWRQARADAADSAHRSGFDFGPLLAGVRTPVHAADLALCHMETPLAPAAGPYRGYPLFSVPPQIAEDIADLGYDACSTASNHTLDQGEAGVVRTLKALDRARLRHAGSYRSKAEHDELTLLDVDGVTVAHLSYTFGFNGLSRPAGKPWLANLIEPAAIEAEARRARVAGAAIVVVSLHWGAEYRHDPDGGQVSLARRLLASPDIDLILGHHAHVVQPFERIGGKWVAYGLGNHVAHHAEPVNDNREGVLARFTFTERSPGRWRVTTAEAIPMWMDLAGFDGQRADRLVDLAVAIADPRTGDAQRARYQSALRRVEGYLLSRGAGDDGLVVASGAR